MPITPEDRARERIDLLLCAAGWGVQDRAALDLTAGPGTAVREFPLKQGHGKADYLKRCRAAVLKATCEAGWSPRKPSVPARLVV
jgi:hypothetical protein